MSKNKIIRGNTNGSPNPCQKIRRSFNKPEKILSSRRFSLFLRDHRMKIKESKKIDKYLELDRELKKLLTIKLTVIPIVNSILGTVPTSLAKGQGEVGVIGKMITIQTTARLESAGIL